MELSVVAQQPAQSLLGTAAAPKPTPLTQTAAVGVIVPPPDIRSVVDKTAQFVARNGTEFEKRILANERNNVKFNFLTPGDPYHAYYQHKVVQFTRDEAGGAKEPVEATPAAAEPAPGRVAVQTATNFKPVVLEAPEKEVYTVLAPEGIAAFDLDVIKLTAQFVARNGKAFLTGLTSREHTNSQFNFLKPTHSMFPLFTALADAYSKVLMPPKTLAPRLQRDAEDRPGVLNRCLKRLEWDRSQERDRKDKEDKEEAERDAMAAVDWHDFVVVETIDFYAEEDEGLPPPLSLADVVAALRELPAEAPALAEPAGADVEMDADERALVVEGAVAQAPFFAPAPAPEPQMKIVRNYKRPGMTSAATDASRFVVSPITGELVPVEHMGEHMRISLIDPKWKEQRDVMLGKLRGSTVASDEEIARNVVRLARTRPDIFGSTDEEVSVAVTAELEARKSVAEPQLPVAAGQLPPRPPAPLHGLTPGVQQLPRQPFPAGMGPPGFPLGGPLMPPPFPPGMPPRPLGMPPAPYGMPLGSMPLGALGPPPFQPPAHLLPAGMPPVGDEGDGKRPRAEEALLGEEDFAEAHQGPVTITVQLPAVEGEAALTGQTLTLELASVMETVGDCKARLAAATGVPASKQKLSTATLGFLKDSATLAAYNFGSGTELILGLKARGGKR